VRRFHLDCIYPLCRQIFEAFKKVILQRTYQVCLARHVSMVKAYRHVRKFFHRSIFKGDSSMLHNSSENGQALIIITLAAIGLFGFTALAIDGGMVFSDRRHSQNASDTAAFAAALARVRAIPDWKQAGLDRAASNDYTNDGTTQVEVYLCSEWQTLSGTSCEGLPAGTDPFKWYLV
jgi:hypothetical protein